MFIVHLLQLFILPLQLLYHPLEREDKQLQLFSLPLQMFIVLHMWKFASSYTAQSDVKYVFLSKVIYAVDIRRKLTFWI